MPFMPFLIGFLAIVIFVVVTTKIRGRDYGKDFEEFIEEENRANAVKSREIDGDIFFDPDLSKLPIKKDAGTETLSARCQSEVVKKAANKMAKLPAPMTNNEIKYKYGTVNLEMISLYEESFFAYIYALNTWAESLLDEGNEKDAEAVLRYGVESGAETSKTYMLLADIYYKRNDRQKMYELYDIISGKKMPAQEKTWNYVNDYYLKMKL